MNIISSCCQQPIIQSTRREYPLGGTTWYETYKVDVCDGCGKECETEYVEGEEE